MEENGGRLDRFRAICRGTHFFILPIGLTREFSKSRGTCTRWSAEGRPIPERRSPGPLEILKKSEFLEQPFSRASSCTDLRQLLPNCQGTQICFSIEKHNSKE